MIIMLIGGFQKSSLIDYPGKICAIIFTQGCNFRCPYCHNPELVKQELFEKPIPEEEILYFLKNRIGKLDAVEITGGEPTLQKGLMCFLKRIKNMGYLVKLDTNGSSPDKLKEIINKKLVDYIAMDVKAPLEKYAFVTRTNVDIGDIQESIDIIMNSNLDYHFRTTVVQSLLNFNDLKLIHKLIKGTNNYVLQKFIFSGKILDDSLLDNPEYNDEEIQKFQNILLKRRKNEYYKR